MNTQEKKVVIESIGGYLPEKTLSNDYLQAVYNEQSVDSAYDITLRHIANNNESLADIAVKAAKRCLGKIGIDDIGCVILATMIPDVRGIATAPVIANQLELGDIPAYDVRAGEAGGMYALQNSICMIKAEVYKKILIIAADINSKYINYADTYDSFLYGDGAVAILLKSSEDGIAIFDGGEFGAFEKYYTAKILPVGGSSEYFNVIGEKKFVQDDAYWKIEYRKLERLANEVLNHIFSSGCAGNVDKYFIQLTKTSIVKQIFEKYEVPIEKAISYINKIGDIGTATTFWGLLNAHENLLLKKKERISLISYGTGGSYGITNWIWNK